MWPYRTWCQDAWRDDRFLNESILQKQLVYVAYPHECCSILVLGVGRRRFGRSEIQHVVIEMLVHQGFLYFGIFRIAFFHVQLNLKEQHQRRISIVEAGHVLLVALQIFLEYRKKS